MRKVILLLVILFLSSFVLTSNVSPKFENGCQWKKSGKGIRKYCCSDNCTRCTLVNGKKVCKSQYSKCKFYGPTITKKVENKCTWKLEKAGKRKECCTIHQSCEDNKCKVVSKKCKSGKLILEKKFYHGCVWKKHGKGRRLYCCSNSCRRCQLVKGKKVCKTQHTNCKWVGKTIHTKFERKCSFIKVGKHAKRKKCCVTRKRCEDDKCKVISKKCSWEGKVIKEKKITWRYYNACRSAPYKRQRRILCCRYLQKCIWAKCYPVKVARCWWVGSAYGDVHLVDAEGKKSLFNKAGIFNYLVDDVDKCKAQIALRKLLHGSVVAGFSMSCENAKITVLANGKVELNGANIKGQTQAKFGSKAIISYDKQNNAYVISTGRGIRITVEYDKTLKILNIQTGLDSSVSWAGKVKGLYMDSMNGDKYALSNPKESLFPAKMFIKFENIPVPKFTTEQKLAAELKCKPLQGEDLKQCAEDYLLTGGQNFRAAFEEQKKGLKTISNKLRKNSF